MSYTALARRWRPRRFDELTGFVTGSVRFERR